MDHIEYLEADRDRFQVYAGIHRLDVPDVQREPVVPEENSKVIPWKICYMNSQRTFRSVVRVVSNFAFRVIRPVRTNSDQLLTGIRGL